MPDFVVNGKPVELGQVRQIQPATLANELHQSHHDGEEQIAFRVGDNLYLAPLPKAGGRAIAPGNAVSFAGATGTVIAIDDQEHERLETRLAMAADESTPGEMLALLADDP